MKDIDKYVEEKPKELSQMGGWDGMKGEHYISFKWSKDFICTIREECKPKVDKAWVQILMYVCGDIENGEMRVEELYEMLKEAGVEVEDK